MKNLQATKDDLFRRKILETEETSKHHHLELLQPSPKLKPAGDLLNKLAEHPEIKVIKLKRAHMPKKCPLLKRQKAIEVKRVKKDKAELAKKPKL